MRRKEFKVCQKCGKVYLWEGGGIVPDPTGFVDYGMCPKCKVMGKLLKKKPKK